MVQYPLPSKECPFCGRDALVEAPHFGKHWFECSNCGATHNVLPKRKRKAKKAKA